MVNKFQVYIYKLPDDYYKISIYGEKSYYIDQFSSLIKYLKKIENLLSDKSSINESNNTDLLINYLNKSTIKKNDIVSINKKTSSYIMNKYSNAYLSEYEERKTVRIKILTNNIIVIYELKDDYYYVWDQREEKGYKADQTRELYIILNILVNNK